jgi:hypothetical protein
MKIKILKGLRDRYSLLSQLIFKFLAGGISVSSCYYIDALCPERIFVELHWPPYVRIPRPYACKVKNE